MYAYHSEAPSRFSSWFCWRRRQKTLMLVGSVVTPLQLLLLVVAWSPGSSAESEEGEGEPLRVILSSVAAMSCLVGKRGRWRKLGGFQVCVLRY